MAKSKSMAINYMLRLIDEKDKDYVSKTIKNCAVSKSTVYNYRNELVENGILEEKDGVFSLVSKKFYFNYDNTKKLSEDVVFYNDIAPMLMALPPQIQNSWNYAFTEMMNNAIEHSEAESIEVVVIKNYVNCQIIIIDNGIGIFKNIQQFMKRERGEDLELSECVSLLFAGKFTTAKENHSGEGIFFTSHLMDKFLIWSDNHVFTRDSFEDIQGDVELPKQTGISTFVSMTMSNDSKKTPNKIFMKYSDIDEGFFKTSIPIGHVFSGRSPVSRSEAKRLVFMITKFKEVVLDFSNVEEIGQAFTHELFVVCARAFPEIKFEIKNANKAVKFMIERVIKTAQQA